MSKSFNTTWELPFSVEDGTLHASIQVIGTGEQSLSEGDYRFMANIYYSGGLAAYVSYKWQDPSYQTIQFLSTDLPSDLQEWLDNNSIQIIQ